MEGIQNLENWVRCIGEQFSKNMVKISYPFLFANSSKQMRTKK
jgi:hypothetical protein